MAFQGAKCGPNEPTSSTRRGSAVALCATHSSNDNAASQARASRIMDVFMRLPTGSINISPVNARRNPDDPDARGVEAVCPRCNQRTQIVGKTYRNWFTVFFIPIFPISGAQRYFSMRPRNVLK